MWGSYYIPVPRSMWDKSSMKPCHVEKPTHLKEITKQELEEHGLATVVRQLLYQALSQMTVSLFGNTIRRERIPVTMSEIKIMVIVCYLLWCLLGQRHLVPETVPRRLCGQDLFFWTYFPTTCSIRTRYSYERITKDTVLRPIWLPPMRP